MIQHNKRNYFFIEKPRTSKLLVILSFFLLCHITTVAQTYENEPESEEVNGDEIIIDNTNVNTDVLNSLGFETDFAPPPSTIIGNLVSVQQIGDFNIANVTAITQTSNISVVQSGNSNQVDLTYNTLSVFTSLNQLGNANQVIDFVSDPNSNPALDLTQQGNNLSFERYGVNNLTNSLKFTQTEASPAIIVRSYQ